MKKETIKKLIESDLTNNTTLTMDQIIDGLNHKPGEYDIVVRTSHGFIATHFNGFKFPDVAPEKEICIGEDRPTANIDLYEQPYFTIRSEAGRTTILFSDPEQDSTRGKPTTPEKLSIQVEKVINGQRVNL